MFDITLTYDLVCVELTNALYTKIYSTVPDKYVHFRQIKENQDCFIS